VKPVVIVTRPAAAGERLHRQLVERGWDAVWWPAFDIRPAPDAARARERLTQLDRFDLAIFVSPIAVQATAALLEAPWSARVAIGAVGEATGQAVRDLLAPPVEVPLVVPPAVAGSGSEAFWSQWTRTGHRAGHVLILRAQHGREWLADRFAAAGAQVESLPVYERVDGAPGAAAPDAVRRFIATSRPLTVFTSSEAVDALDRRLATEPGALAWLRSGTALASHARIRERLLAAGYTRVELTPADDASLMARLELLQRSSSA
jgi:uroporphyrinogen-III synthase